MAKAFFVDLSRCTACRGCQVACKQWKNLPAEKTTNTGSHQNPPDLSAVTYKTVHFQEEGSGVDIQWNFFPEQCRHCVNPPCYYTSEIEGAIIQDEETGSVYYTDLTKELNFDDIRESCPYDIPRLDEVTKIIHKCDMCNDRIHAGLQPSCVESCPTGCMNFGEEDAMLELANARLLEVQKKYPNATLGDPDSVLVIYLFLDDPLKTHPFAIASNDKVLPSYTRQQFLAKVRGKKHIV